MEAYSNVYSLIQSFTPEAALTTDSVPADYDHRVEFIVNGLERIGNMNDDLVTRIFIAGIEGFENHVS